MRGKQAVQRYGNVVPPFAETQAYVKARAAVPCVLSSSATRADEAVACRDPRRSQAIVFSGAAAQ